MSLDLNKKYTQFYTDEYGLILQQNYNWDPNGNHELWGELTMIGVTKNIKLNVEFGGILNDPWGNEKAGFTVTGKINRSDWGLIWNTAMEAGGFMVSEEVTISCEMELINIGQTNLKMQLEPIALLN